MVDGERLHCSEAGEFDFTAAKSRRRSNAVFMLQLQPLVQLVAGDESGCRLQALKLIPAGRQ